MSEAQLILQAIHNLRTELSERMDRQDRARDMQWEHINKMEPRICPAERHEDIENRVKSLEFDRAKMTGIVLTVSVIASLVGWGIERMLR